MADQGLEGSNPVDLSKHPSGIVPTLQNIVSTVNLDCKLDLKAIALQARNAEYNPKYARIVQNLGFPAKFKVDCKELFYRDLPTLDDFLADKLLPGCTTLKEVEEILTKRCQEMEQEAKVQATDNAILDQIRKMVEVRFLDLYLRNKEDSFMELGF